MFKLAVICLTGLALTGSAGAEITFRPEAEGQAKLQASIARLTPEQRAQAPWLTGLDAGKRLPDGAVRDVPFTFPILAERLAGADVVDPLHAQLFDNTVHSTHSPSRELIETRTTCLWKKASAVGPDADGSGRTRTVVAVYDCGPAYLVTVETDHRTSRNRTIMYNDALHADPVGNRFMTHQAALRHDGQMQTNLTWLNARYTITYELTHPEHTDFDIPGLRAVLDTAARQQYAAMEAGPTSGK